MVGAASEDSDSEEFAQESWPDWLKRTAARIGDFIKSGHITDWVEEQRRRKWRWAGHVMRREDDRWTTRIVHWVPQGGERLQGRPLARWEDALVSFCKDAGFRWETIAQDRGIWESWEEEFVRRGGGSSAA